MYCNLCGSRHRRELVLAGDCKAIRDAKIEEFKDRFANPYITAERGYIDEDRMCVRAEPVPELAAERYQDLTRSAEGLIHAAIKVKLAIEVVSPGTLPRYELKTRRIIDQRPKEIRRALDRQ